MSIRDELKYLLEKHLTGQISAGEKSRFVYLLQQKEYRFVIAEIIEEVLHQQRYHELSGLNRQELFDQVIREAELRNPVPEALLSSRPLWKRFSFAASFLILLGGAALLFIYLGARIHTPAPAALADIKKTVTPSSDKVMLTLADGSRVAIDEVKDGSLKGQQGITIIKSGKGEVIYKISDQAATLSAPAYNIITTPRGGQYHIILPDNTEVWLNAASSLKFPVSFPGRNRQVTLTGEGYFEVAKNASKPFSVMVNDIQVNVLGTSFNIMAYSDEEAVKTTLLNGSVKLTSKAANTILLPGQQASISGTSPGFALSDAKIDEVMAWKNGEFRFQNTQIDAIMRQIARWYDLEVTYHGDLSDIALSGVISRKQSASQLLEILEATHRVHFSMQGNRVTLTPYDRK